MLFGFSKTFGLFIKRRVTASPSTARRTPWISIRLPQIQLCSVYFSRSDSSCSRSDSSCSRSEAPLFKAVAFCSAGARNLSSSLFSSWSTARPEKWEYGKE